MFTGRFFIAVVAIAVAITFIQWFFVGFLFHKYQGITPLTWRKESTRSYWASAMLSLFFAFMFTLIISFWIGKFGPLKNMDGLEFGAVCWLTFAIPMEIGTAIYVNYSRIFVMGKCLSALVEYMAAGWLAVSLS
jgi:hypothetical protein